MFKRKDSETEDLSTPHPNPDSEFDIKENILQQISDIEIGLNNDKTNEGTFLGEDVFNPDKPSLFPGYLFFEKPPKKIYNIKDFILKNQNGASVIHWTCLFHDTDLLDLLIETTQKDFKAENDKIYYEKGMIKKFLEAENSINLNNYYDEILKVGSFIEDEKSKIIDPEDPNAKAQPKPKNSQPALIEAQPQTHKRYCCSFCSVTNPCVECCSAIKSCCTNTWKCLTYILCCKFWDLHDTSKGTDQSQIMPISTEKKSKNLSLLSKKVMYNRIFD